MGTTRNWARFARWNVVPIGTQNGTGTETQNDTDFNLYRHSEVDCVAA